MPSPQLLRPCTHGPDWCPQIPRSHFQRPELEPTDQRAQSVPSDGRRGRSSGGSPRSKVDALAEHPNRPAQSTSRASHHSVLRPRMRRTLSVPLADYRVSSANYAGYSWPFATRMPTDDGASDRHGEFCCTDHREPGRRSWHGVSQPVLARDSCTCGVPTSHRSGTARRNGGSRQSLMTHARTCRRSCSLMNLTRSRRSATILTKPLTE